MSELPVVVIGAGPLGLAAAAHLLERELTPLVVEAGDSAGSAIAQWGHVRTFSPWPELVDPAAARLLEPTGWTAADAGYPTGREWIDEYLSPLADALGERVRFGSRVEAVSRQGGIDWSARAGPRRRSWFISVTRRGRNRGCRPARSSTPREPGANRILLALTVFPRSVNAQPQPRVC